MRELAEQAVTERLSRLHWVEGLGAPLIEGHMPAEVVGEQSQSERAWFALARQVTVPEHDHVVLPAMRFTP